jgi:hypothetical protein
MSSSDAAGEAEVSKGRSVDDGATTDEAGSGVRADWGAAGAGGWGNGATGRGGAGGKTAGVAGAGVIGCTAGRGARGVAGAVEVTGTDIEAAG